MLILLSCAKTMSDVSKVKVPFTTIPYFQKEAAEIALEMSQFSVEELEHLLRVNPKIALTLLQKTALTLLQKTATSLKQ